MNPVNEVKRNIVFIIHDKIKGSCSPTGVAIDPESEQIYISDWIKNCIYVYDKNMKKFNVFNNNVPVKAPRGLRFKHGMLYVAESDGNIQHSCIKVFQRDGKLVEEFGSWGWHETQFYLSLSLDVNINKDIYICDAKNMLIKVFSSEGKFINKFGRPNMRWPIDIRIHKTLIYVLEYKNPTVFVFDLEHNYITEFSPPARYNPSYFVINSNDELIFSEKDSCRLVKINGYHSLVLQNQENLKCSAEGNNSNWNEWDCTTNYRQVYQVNTRKGIEIDNDGNIINIYGKPNSILQIIEDPDNPTYKST